MAGVLTIVVASASWLLVGCFPKDAEAEFADADRNLSEDDPSEAHKMVGLLADGLCDPWNENPLHEGEPAPNFELMPLKFYEFSRAHDAEPNETGSIFEPVSLSSFRGSLPVVLVFGSYT